MEITTSRVGRINVYIKGNLTKPPVIFLHGNSLSGKTFEKQFESIHDFPLIAIDFPGHGLSDAAPSPEGTYSFPGYVKAVKEAIQELKLNGYILTGHSLGGHVAIESVPGLSGLKGVFVFGTPPLGMPPALDKAFFPHPAIPLLFKDELSEEDINALTASFVLEDKAIIEDCKRQIRQTDKQARSFFGASIGQGKMQDETLIVKNLSIPLAVIHGEKDALINAEYFKSISAPTLWKNKIHVIANSGHSPQAEQPQVFNALLREFYQSIFS